MDQIAVGLIGYGLAGSVFHAPLVEAEPRMRLASVVTSRKEQVASDLPGRLAWWGAPKSCSRTPTSNW